MADTTVKIVIDASQATPTLKSLTQGFKDLESSAKTAAKATDEVTKSTKDMGDSFARARPHLISLIQDLVEGRGAIRSFGAQGTDIVKSFGSIGAALEGLGSLLLSPIGLMGMLAAAIGGVGIAAVKGSNELDGLRNQLKLTGDFAGMTAGSIELLSQNLKGGSVTGGDMHEALTMLAASGRFTAPAMESVGKSIKLISDLSGEAADKVTKELMKAFNGSASGIKDLNDRIHFLTAAQEEHIGSLIRQGKQQQAVIEASGLLNDKLKNQQKELGIVAGLWEGATQKLSDFWNALKNIGKEDTALDLKKMTNNLDLLKKRMAEIEAIPVGQRTQNQIQVLEKLTQARVNAEKNIAEATTKITADTAQANANSQQALREEEQARILEANRGLGAGIELEKQKIGFAERKAALDIRAARDGDASVARARAELAYDEKIAALNAEQKRLNEMEPMKAGSTNARIDAAKKVAMEERVGAELVAEQKEKTLSFEFSEQLRLHQEKLKQGYAEIDLGEIQRKQTVNGIELEMMLRERLKKMGDPQGNSYEGQDLKRQIELQKQVEAGIINSTEVQKMYSGITGDLHRKLLADTQTQSVTLKDQREILLANSAVEQRVIQENIRLRQAEEQELLKIQKMYGERTDLTADEIEQQQMLTKALKKEYDERRASSKANIEADQKAISSASFGFEESFAKISRMAKTPAEMVGATVDTIFGDMNKALDTFVDTGKLSFSDFASSVIRDLMKIELKESTVALFKASKAALGGIFGLPGYADGGDPLPGQPAIVGERGPEIFIPKSAGTIIPNNQISLGGGGGGDTYHTHNYNIQAVDAKSVAQLFAENRLTMFGMVEQARRELPMRTR